MPCAEVPGVYTRTGEWGGSGQQGGRGEEARGRPPDLTWDTLKRLRRATSQAKRGGQFGSVQCLPTATSEQYQSTPSLWSLALDLESQQTEQAGAVLKFTSKERGEGDGGDCLSQAGRGTAH